MTQPSPSPARAGAITAVLGLLSLFPPLATDMYLAGIGDLAHSFNATHTAAELSLSLFFLGLCAGQLLIGPLTDGFGRKVPLLIGTVLFVVTSVILPLVNDIAVFNALRFLQAVGASAGMVVGRAIVRDLYHGRRAAQVMTVLVMLLTIGPIVSPTLGGVLLEAFGWRSIFATMATIGAVAFALSLLVLPETLPASKRTNHPFVNGTRRAKTLLSQPGFLIMALVGGLSQAGMFAFITGSSGVFQGVYGLSTFGFGLMFAGIAAALIVFGRINSVLLRRFSPDEILKRGLPAFVLSAAVLTLMSGTSTLWILVIPLWFTVGMVGLLSANAMAMAMELAETGAGMGSALLGAIQFAVAFTVSTSVALGGTATALPMCLGLLIPAILATVLYFAGGRLAEAETSQQEAA